MESVRDIAAEILLGRPISWWGKLFLFVAGLSVLIDLFEPDTLRASGMRARDKAKAAGQRRKDHQLIDDLVGARGRFQAGFLEVDPNFSLRHAHRPRTRLASEPPATSPWTELEVHEYHGFWHEVMNELPRLHRKCNGSHDDVCPRQLVYITERVDNLMRARLGQRNELLEPAIGAQEAGFKAFTLWRYVVLAFPVVLLLVWNYGSELEPATRILILYVPLGVILSITLAKLFPGVVPAVFWWLRALPLLWGASLLDRKRPLHPFRLLALALFIAGSLIDLLTAG